MPSEELCPVCYTPMEVHIDVIDVYQGMGPESEHFSLCPNKCYDYQYAYGTTVVSVLIRGHLVTFGWSYSEEDTKPERDGLDLAIKAAQMAQLEDYWNIVHGRNSGTPS